MARIVVLDASALIALFDVNDTHHEWARGLFARTLDDEWVMSAITFAETLVQPIRAQRFDEFEKSVRGLRIRVMGLSDDSSLTLATLRVDTGLRMPDVVALQVAMDERGVLATCDRKLASAAEDRNVPVEAP